MKRARSLTMVDIAKHSGVAVSTVSYALSGKRSVSPETRLRVQQAIDELGFRLHAPARALRARSARALSLFFPSTRDSLEIESHIFLSGAIEATSELDYSLLVSRSTHVPGDISAVVETGRADGVILMEVRLSDERVKRLRADDVPFSLVGRCRDNEGLDFVDFDFEDAVQQAVHHLHELGHRHIVLLNRIPSIGGDDYGPTARSTAGFQKAVRELSMTGDQLLYRPSGEHYGEVLRFLNHSPACTAAIAVSMTYAPLLSALRDLDRRVPDDFSVVAIMASQVAALVTPQLTSIDVPAFEMGRLGAEILIRRLTDETLPPSQVLLQGSLNVRSSAQPPRRPRGTGPARPSGRD